MHSNIPPRAPYSNPLDLVKQFLKASICGLSQITIKFEPWAAAYVPYTDYGLETDVSYYHQETSLLNKDIESLNARLGIMGKLERVVSADVEECWFWDGGKGGLGALRWKENPDVADGREIVDGLGNLLERSARAWTRDLSIRREL